MVLRRESGPRFLLPGERDLILMWLDAPPEAVRALPYPDWEDTAEESEAPNQARLANRGIGYSFCTTSTRESAKAPHAMHSNAMRRNMMTLVVALYPERRENRARELQHADLPPELRYSDLDGFQHSL